MPTYQIRNIHTGAVRLVEAPVPATAIRHVAESDYEVTKPSAADAARLVMQGVVLEVADAQPRAKAPAVDPKHLPMGGVYPKSED